MLKQSIIAIAMLSLTGCASIVSGTNQSISVVTKTPEARDLNGAQCTLTNDKGQWFVTTPGSVTVHRSFSDLAVDCKVDQYAGTIQVKSSTKGMALGNILFGGIIGAGVDIGTGAAYDYPNGITVTVAGGKVPIGEALPIPSPEQMAQVSKGKSIRCGVKSGDSKSTCWEE